MSSFDFMGVVGAACKAMSFVVKYDLLEKYAPDHDLPESALMAAMEDAHLYVGMMHEAGHGVAVTAMMEGIEASMWLWSPEEDYETHLALVLESYRKVCAFVPEEVAEEEDPELTAKKESLEKLLSL